MLTVIVDLRVTRRKTVHTVVDPHGQVEYSAGRIGDVLDWFRENDVSAFNIETQDGHTYRLSLSATKGLLIGFIEKTQQPTA